MISKDRLLYGVVIRQDIKTSFMSLTGLQEAYTRKGECRKDILYS